MNDWTWSVDSLRKVPVRVARSRLISSPHGRRILVARHDHFARNDFCIWLFGGRRRLGSGELFGGKQKSDGNQRG